MTKKQRATLAIKRAVLESVGYPSFGPADTRAAWEAFNERRAELIERGLDEGLAEDEAEEFATLQDAADRFLNAAYPLPPA